MRAAAALVLIGSLRYFDLIWVMTEGGPDHHSELMATYMVKRAFGAFEMGYGSTVASALFIVVAGVSAAGLYLTRRAGGEP